MGVFSLLWTAGWGRGHLICWFSGGLNALIFLHSRVICTFVCSLDWFKCSLETCLCVWEWCDCRLWKTKH